MKKKYKDLKKLLEHIKELTELYNKLSSEEKIEIKKLDEKKYTKELFICKYNDDCVGLFKKENIIEDETRTRNLTLYTTRIAFIGINSNNFGMIDAHLDNNFVLKNSTIGTLQETWHGKYIVNCEINDYIDFEDMRLKMYNEGQITSYEIGKASSSEILEVLKYAYNYYNSENTKIKNKIPNN